MSLDFPWGSLINAALQKKLEQDRRTPTGLDQLNQAFPALNQISGDFQKQALSKRLSEALSQPQMLPVQGPQMPGMQPQPGQPGTMAPNPRSDISPIMAQLYPEEFGKAMFSQMDPVRQSQIARNNAQAQRYQTGTSQKPTGTIYRNSATGEMTDDPNQASGPEWKAYKTTQGDVLNKLSGQTSSKERNKALGERSEAWQRSIDVRQIDQLAKSTGLTAKQQGTLQQNNLRADRAIQVLSKPKITWQELALGEIDLAGIMQGGVPHVDEVKNVNFPGWQEQWANWKTYATGHPTENVPDPIRKKVMGLVRDVVKIDNRFIHANSTFQKQMIGPTIRGGIGQFQKPINEMTNVLSSQPGGNSGQDDPLGIR